MDKYEVKLQKLKNGETMAYRHGGHGDKILVLIHGNQSSSFFYEDLMKRFENEAEIYAIDMIGFGDSSWNNPHKTMKDWADDVALFMDELKLKDAVVLGWSAGGGTAMELAANYPDKVSHLVLLASVSVKGFPLYRFDSKFKPILTEPLVTEEEIASDPVLIIPTRTAIANKNFEFLKQAWKMSIFSLHQPEEELFNRYMHEITKERCFFEISVALVQFNITREKSVVEGSGRIANIKCPVTWIHGDKDIVVLPFLAQTSIPYFETDAKLEMIENAGHASFMDEPEKFDAVLRKVLQA